jgi:hypothetical protein
MHQITEASITERIAQLEPPTPKQIDDLCLAYDSARAKVEAAEAIAKEAKDALLVVVRAHGFVPVGAEKTRRLEGTLYIADSTVSTKTEVKESSVINLMFELLRCKKSKLFHECFEPITKHILRKGASEYLKLGIASMPQSRQNIILAMFASCFDAKTSAPSLSVDLVETLKRKENEAAAKALKKAAAAAKKSSKPAMKGAGR